MLSAKDKIIRSKVQLQGSKPFFSYLIMNLRCREDKRVPSMGVDIRGNLFYNEKWIDTLDDNVVEGVLVHEVLHIVLQHLNRKGTRDHKLFNIANDMVVNDIIVTEGMNLPEDGILPKNHEFTIEQTGYVIKDINLKTSEEVYDELYHHIQKNKDKFPKSQDGSGIDLGDIEKGFDEHNYADGEQAPGEEGKGQGKISKSELGKLEKKWKEALATATQEAQKRGLVPAGMERYVDEILEGKVSWRHKLARYITNSMVSDFTWSRPSKRSASIGIYMPSVVRENVEIVVAVDTSGSIGQKELTEFLSEICSIARSFSNISMDLVIGDCQLTNHYQITNNTIGDILSLKIGGGGGTSHKFVQEWMEENKPNAKLLIALTDGYSDIQSVFPEIKCGKIILLSENGTSEKNLEEFGECIKLK